jgi:hypothetical protein
MKPTLEETRLLSNLISGTPGSKYDTSFFVFSLGRPKITIMLVEPEQQAFSPCQSQTLVGVLSRLSRSASQSKDASLPHRVAVVSVGRAQEAGKVSIRQQT